MAYLEPRYTIPHRSTFSRKLIPELYNETQDKMKHSLKSVLHGSLTLDMWSSISKQDYMSLTFNSFTSEMERLEYCLEVIPFTFHHHAAGNISSFLKTTLESWEISQSKIHCVITDNAKNMISGMKEARLDRAPCAAHTLQLVVNNSVLKQRNVHDMCSRAKKVVGHFHHSVLATKKLAEFQQQNSLPKNRLKQDEPTRWDSTFFMLQRLFEQRKAVMYLLPELNLLVDLSSADWNLMEKVLPLLELFHRATLAVSNSQTTISEIIPIVNGLKMDLEQFSDETVHASLHSIVKDVVHLLNEYYCNVETESNLFRFAKILDPRFKTSVFSEPGFAEQGRQALLQELENVLPVDPTESKVLRLATPSGPMSSVYSRLIAAKSNASIENCVSVSARQQLQKYLAEPLLPTDESPFLYWKSSEFKSLKKLAVKYLSPPAASVPSERLFSTAGLISSKNRSSLNPEKVRMLVFLNKNLQYFT
ncbi:zinc finger BED domain-containing protein 4-like [Bacillus rossius redtenbacheri]|uniref:zinc finger BED domain-containing protein 4-like n=1 Tax=Bacillus rossius redtenbacheri TaxID=93214 RepID=UPI002FDC8835